MAKTEIPGLGTVEKVEVVVDETKTSKVVKTLEGKLVNIETALPDVRKGHKGLLFEVDGRTVFIREPYE